MVVVRVPGMLERSDVRLISACVADLPGVGCLQVDMAAKTVTVHGDVSAALVGAAIAVAGFEVSDAPE